MTRIDRPTKSDLERESAGRLRTIQFYGTQVQRMQAVLRDADNAIGNYFSSCICEAKDPCKNCRRIAELRVRIKQEMPR